MHGGLGSLANLMKTSLSYGVPQFQSGADPLTCLNFIGTDSVNQQDIMLADTRFHVCERSIKGSLIIIFNVGSVQTLVRALETLAV